ncbi:MAG: hypothetical protein R3357_04760 [Burkholderiales bacterium]|nr:hypothetical protein [Burkholderiales bacterium]
MWVILLEIALVIGLAVLIVWWTWPKTRSADRPDAERKNGESEP